MKALLGAAFLSASLSVSSFADGLTPDRAYVTIATRHYGLGEEVFGVNGPNEVNPGLGVAWLKRGHFGFNYSAGVYKDSFSDLAFTGGVSIPWISGEKFAFSSGLSFTKSLGGDQLVEFRKKDKIVKSRQYVWPYMNFEYKNAFVQLRPGLNRDLKPAGVFAFGIAFNLKKFTGQKESAR